MYRCFCLGAVLAWFLKTVSSSHLRFSEVSPAAALAAEVNGLPFMISSLRLRSSSFAFMACCRASSSSRSRLIFASSAIRAFVSSSSSSSPSSSSSSSSSSGRPSSSASSGNGLFSMAIRSFLFFASSRAFLRSSFFPSRSSRASSSFSSRVSRNSLRDKRSSGAPWLAFRNFRTVVMAASLLATFEVWQLKDPPLGLVPLPIMELKVGRWAVVICLV
mmetsp:Transcript_61262/g.145850  ORF Transcript_61262/g.145850 Transcript_61262/m.145850 type:complete len:218 (+) Transcript_61262:185-838(+)